MAQKPTRRFVAARTAQGKEERDLEVEQDEQDRDEVVAHVELHARVLEGLEAAFVGEFFASGRRPEPAEEEHLGMTPGGATG